MGSVGPTVDMQSDLKRAYAENSADMQQRASGASVQSAEQIQKQVRDTRQTVESQVLKNKQEMASSQQELKTQRNTPAGSIRRVKRLSVRLWRRRKKAEATAVVSIRCTEFR